MSISLIENSVCPRARSRVHMLLALLLAVLATSVTLAPARADDRDDEDSYEIGLWGDLPYSLQQVMVGVPNLIADMNAHRLKFTVHDGDLKAGSNSPCDDALYSQSLN